MKVVSWNIRYGAAPDGENSWENRREGVFELLTDLDADVVGLQEALDFQIEEILVAVPGYRVFGVGHDVGGAGEFAAVLYRDSVVRLLDGGTRWISECPGVAGSLGPGANLPRVVTWCVFSQDDLGATGGLFDADARLGGERMLAQGEVDELHQPKARNRFDGTFGDFVDRVVEGTIGQETWVEIGVIPDQLGSLIKSHNRFKRNNGGDRLVIQAHAVRHILKRHAEVAYHLLSPNILGEVGEVRTG